VTKPGASTILIRYGPQRRYDVALAVTGASLLVATALVAVRVRRRRRTQRPAATVAD
jgi:hypothetical protein